MRMRRIGEKLRFYRELTRFLARERFVGCSIDERPYFDDASTRYFMSVVRDCRFYLEYGSEGSTVMAARLNKPFISVETDKYFLKAVRKKIGPLMAQQRLIHADIGLTGFWGSPMRGKNPSAHRLRKWNAYPGKPWRFISGEDMPDLVLIDGRFRVAATLTCCMNLRNHPAAKILVDDYLDRPEYHVIASHAVLEQTVGRMAVFQPSVDDGKLMAELISQYSADWR
jgi:hypothetical protein